MASRLLYVMDPMCSWCWGFAPVVKALAEQAAVDGVPLQIVTGGLRRDQLAINAAARVRVFPLQRVTHFMRSRPEKKGRPNYVDILKYFFIIFKI